MTQEAVNYEKLAGSLMKKLTGNPAEDNLPIRYGPDGQIVRARLSDQIWSQTYGGFRSAQKAVGSTPTASYGHGQFGLFSSPAMDRQVFSALMLPRQGILDRLPVRKTNLMQPLFSIMTGVTATTGSEPNGPCDDFPVAGLMKLCSQTRYLGRQGRQTPIFELDRMGLVNSRGEHIDLQLMNNALTASPQVGPMSPMIPGAGNPLQTEIAKAVFELGTAWKRDFAYETYTGNPTNNGFGGGRKYFRGLDLLINTGYRDGETSTVCPAADSIVESFGSLDIATNAAAFVRRIHSIYRRLKWIATATGSNPVKWVIAMPWALFMEIMDIYPIAYNTFRGSSLFSTAQVETIDARYLNELRNEMKGDTYELTGQYLTIDNENVEVVIDNAITETVLPGASFTAPIYFIPMTVLGGVEVTYMEYVDYDAPNGPMDAARFFAPPGMFFTSDSGRFLWLKEPPTNFCVRVKAKTEPTIVMRTPYLAARLTSIKYTPLAKERGWDPVTGNAGNSFYTDGGGTSRSTADVSFYTPT